MLVGDDFVFEVHVARASQFKKSCCAQNNIKFEKPKPAELQNSISGAKVAILVEYGIKYI